MAFWEDSLRYLYLPRLKNKSVLAAAIRSGAASKDFFGTAAGQSGEEFEGFRFGSGDVQLDDTLLLIHPATAAEVESTLTKKVVETIPPDESGAGLNEVPGKTPGVVNPPPITPPPAKAKAFHGAVDINPSTAKMRLVQVAEEVINLLTSDPNAQVRVTVEIDAIFPNSASDQTKRAVSENANSLGFKSKDWE